MTPDHRASGFSGNERKRNENERENENENENGKGRQNCAFLVKVADLEVPVAIKYFMACALIWTHAVSSWLSQAVCKCLVDLPI